ncbi:hypothetical protein KZY62_10335 [Prevotella denticola]|nr:hypothetical protein [Prevotella denticola]
MEEPYYVLGFFLFRLVRFLLLLAVDVAWSIAQHHDKRLEVHAVQDVVYAPPRGTRYLPDKPERAMGAFPTAL